MRRTVSWIAFVCALAGSFAVLLDAQARPRARDLGIIVGVYPAGPNDAITDVVGVRVGQTTVISGEQVRTGVTAVLPHGGNLFQDKVAGAVFVGNAFGKLAGSTQVNELGTIETPIVLTNTLSVGAAMDAVVRYTIGQPGNEQVRSVNALVGETNDGGLNDIRGLHVTREHVLAAIASAATGPVAEGSVGAGTGTINYGWKGGIGTASRKLPADRGAYTVGVLTQTNFGGNLTIAGVPVYRTLQPRRARDGAGVDNGDGSCMLVVATDAPLDARDLKRLAARARLRRSRRARSSAWRAPGRPTATAAAISRLPSPPRRICAAGSTTPRRGRARCCRRTRPRRCSKRRWKRPKKPSTTRCSRRPRCARRRGRR